MMSSPDSPPRGTAARGGKRSTRSLVQAIRRHPVVAYVCLAYGLSWSVAVFLIADVVPEAVHLAVALGPAVAALTVSRVAGGRHAVVSLWVRIRDWRLVPSWRWWLLSVSPLGFLAVGIAVAGLAGDNPGSVDWEADFDGGGWVVGLLGASLAFGVFEEFGWRGFLLPSLQKSRSASMATFFVWLIWAGWHAPMFAYQFTFGPALAIGWLVGLYFGAVLLTCLHNSTHGSLAAVILFHATYDFASILGAAVADVAVAAVAALVVLTTIGVARWGGPADLSRYGRFIID